MNAKHHKSVVKEYHLSKMIRDCQSCGKEYQSFTEGVVYSSTTKGIAYFCSDVCCKDYLNNKPANVKK